MQPENPQAPKSLKEMYTWLFFDPQRLEEFEEDRIFKQRFKDWEGFWKPLLFNSLIAVGLWLLLSSISVVVFPKEFLQKSLQTNWSNNYLLNYKEWLIGSLDLVIRIFTIISVLFSLFFGSFFGLLFILSFGLISGLFGGTFYGMYFNLSLGFVVHLSLARGFKWNLSWGLSAGLSGVLIGMLLLNTVNIINELTYYYGWLIFNLTWAFIYFRVAFLLFYALLNLFNRYNFYNNPYRYDSLIWFFYHQETTSRLWYFSAIVLHKTDQKLITYAFENPTDQEITNFIQFLTNRRIFQKKLAYVMLAARYAGLWKQDRFKNWEVLEDILPEVEDKKVISLVPSEAWYEGVTAIKDALSDYRKENSLQMREFYLQKLQKAVENFEQQNDFAPAEWKTWYQQTIKVWKKALEEEKTALREIQETTEPLGANIYRQGAKLQPQDKAVFFGRDELRQRLKNRILTSREMPLFFIVGQRRTGKSSLISFLPDYLDSGFAVISIDLQNEVPATLAEFFKALLNRTEKFLRKPETEFRETDWRKVWLEVRQRLTEYAQNSRKKIILAIDEYEELHYKLLQKTPDAADFLKALRGYTQEQNEVVFLFAGQDKMTEFQNPTWQEISTLKETLKIDYLNRQDTEKLIDAYPALRYEAAVRDRIFELTQGQPAMLQIILGKIVERANLSRKTDIGQAELDGALQESFWQADDNVISVFWTQFCVQRNLRPTIFEILARQTPTDKFALFQLTDHEFVIEKEGKYQFRVPLFDQWLRKFAEVVK